MNRKPLARAVTAAVLLASPAFAGAQATPAPAAAPASQGYIVASGPASTECPGFIDTVGKARMQKSGSTGYAGDMQGFAMFVSGFQTAYNLQTPETCDIFAGWNNNQVLDWLEKFCRANPKERFGAGVIALAKERYPSRSKKCG
jgi:hypothetical protein